MSFLQRVAKIKLLFQVKTLQSCKTEISIDLFACKNVVPVRGAYGIDNRIIKKYFRRTIMSKKFKKVTKKIELPKSSYQLLEAAAALHGLKVEQYMVDAIVSTVLSDLEMLENCLENLGELEKMSRDVAEVEVEEEAEVVPAPEKKKVSKKKKAEKKEELAPEVAEEAKDKKAPKKAPTSKAKSTEKVAKEPAPKEEKPARVAKKKTTPAKKAVSE